MSKFKIGDRIIHSNIDIVELENNPWASLSFSRYVVDKTPKMYKIAITIEGEGLETKLQEYIENNYVKYDKERMREFIKMASNIRDAIAVLRKAHFKWST